MMATREKRWQYPERDAPRGRLSQREEADILATPRPADAVVQAERVTFLRDHPQTPDTARHPHDRIPSKLHESRQVDDLGTPAMAEAFLRYLSGEQPLSFRERMLGTILTEIQRDNHGLWVMLEEHFFFKRSLREMAECTYGGLLSKSKIEVVITATLQQIQQRLDELCGTST